MQVFKVVLKIIKKNLFSILMYFGIFLAFTFIFIQTSSDNQTYEKIKVDTYVVIEEESEYADKLMDYLNQHIEIVDIKNQTVEDAMYYRDIKMYICIKEGFKEKLFTEETDLIEVKYVPESMDASNLRSTISSYINNLRKYVKMGLATEETAFETLNKALKDASENSEVILPPAQERSSSIYGYYNYSGYIISAVVLFIVSIIMASFKPLDIKRRMNICAISNRKIDTILVISNLVVSVIFCLLLFLLALILYKSKTIDGKIIYYIINSLVLSLVMVTMAYFLTTLIDSNVIIQALGTVIPLAGAFLGGIFVPIEFMNKSVLVISKLTPQYWFLMTNNYIYNNEVTFTGFISKIGITLIFALVFVVGIILASKLKQKQETQSK